MGRLFARHAAKMVSSLPTTAVPHAVALNALLIYFEFYRILTAYEISHWRCLIAMKRTASQLIYRAVDGYIDIL